MRNSHMLDASQYCMTYDIGLDIQNLPKELFNSKIKQLHDRAIIEITARVYKEAIGSQEFSHPLTWRDAWKLEVFYPFTSQIISRWPVLTKLVDFFHSKMTSPKMKILKIDSSAVYPDFVPPTMNFSNRIIIENKITNTSIRYFSDVISQGLNTHE